MCIVIAKPMPTFAITKVDNKKYDFLALIIIPKIHNISRYNFMHKKEVVQPTS